MLKKLIALTAAAAAAALAVPAPAAAAAGGSSATQLLRLRAGLTLEIPKKWRVYGTKDQVRVVTGACKKPKSHYFEPKCDSFWIMGPKALKTGGEGFQRYNPINGPFYPAVDVVPCSRNPKYGQVIGKAVVVSSRNVGVAHKAHYRVWPVRCITYDGAVQKLTFKQREWYLAKQQILIVDQWNTPGLATILKNAVWDN